MAKLLAAAYTDTNSNNKFDGKDTLIAGLYDTDKSKDLSIGDTVTFGTYPHLDGSAAGKFQHVEKAVTDFTITSEPTFDSVSVTVDGGRVDWTITPTSESFSTINTEPLTAGFESNFIDFLDDSTPDHIRVNAKTDPGHPDTAPILEDADPTDATHVGDNGFLDIFIA